MNEIVAGLGVVSLAVGGADDIERGKPPLRRSVVPDDAHLAVLKKRMESFVGYVLWYSQ